METVTRTQVRGDQCLTVGGVVGRGQITEQFMDGVKDYVFNLSQGKALDGFVHNLHQLKGFRMWTQALLCKRQET